MGKRKTEHWRCPKCLRATKRTRHHMHPRRYFGGTGPLINLCRECHDDLEAFIADAEAQRLAKCGSRKFSRLEYEYLFNIWFKRN